MISLSVFFFAVAWLAYSQPQSGSRTIIIWAFLLRASLALVQDFLVPLLASEGGEP